MTPLDALIDKLLDREGGIADVGDGKGVTSWGQTPAWLAEFNLSVPENREQAASNYLIWLEEIGLKPLLTPWDDLADILLDIAVMSSAQKAVKALQSALGVPVDGVLGPRTMAALSGSDRRQLARNVIAWDIEYQGRVITDNPQRAEYAAGWAKRMAAHVRRLA